MSGGRRAFSLGWGRSSEYPVWIASSRVTPPLRCRGIPGRPIRRGTSSRPRSLRPQVRREGHKLVDARTAARADLTDDESGNILHGSTLPPDTVGYGRHRRAAQSESMRAVPKPGDAITAFSVRPGHCFRMVYDYKLQHTHCRQPPSVEGDLEGRQGAQSLCPGVPGARAEVGEGGGELRPFLVLMPFRELIVIDIEPCVFAAERREHVLDFGATASPKRRARSRGNFNGGRRA